MQGEEQVCMSINCTLCEKEAKLSCPRCAKILYCSQEHLKDNIVNHKTICHPYVITSNKLLGRFLVAGRNIKQGEVILQEKPLVFGPAENSNAPICTSCGGIPTGRCNLCQIALMCGPKCSGEGHSNLECQTYQKISEKLKQKNFISNNLVLPLRCFINLKVPKDKWLNFFTLESHSDERKGTSIWEIHHQNIIKVFQKWGIITGNEKDEELIQEIMGILDVNTFAIRCGFQSQGRALYTEAAMMAHDCFPNCLIAVDNNYLMTIKARRDIPAGEPITHNYTNTLHGTVARREHLSETKYFTCNCIRCHDPTELGTHMSSFICPRCRTGFVVFNNESNFLNCNQCLHKFSNGLFKASLNHIQNLIDDLDKNNLEEVENMLKKLSKTLAPNHSFLIDLKQQLAVLYRDKRPTIDVFNKRKKICEDLLTVIEALEPGISRLRGIALYELYGIIHGQAELKQKHLTLLQEAECILKDSVSMLLHEPMNSPEGELARQALSELKSLRDHIQKATKKKSKKKK